MINSKCYQSWSNSTNIWRFAVYLAFYWHSWNKCHFFSPSCISDVKCNLLVCK